ncbi:MAG: aminotransferase class I/II-fold pyridoxal phosphate-dependent enzyme [Phycisphaerae bacterium]|nr:aminotransferase class I/II-fold pyridoxal phosphate-dependent enzyme [Phycisphaerae bacterium]
MDETVELTRKTAHRTSWADCYDVPGPDLFDKVHAFAQYVDWVHEKDHCFFRWPLSSPNSTRVVISHPTRGEPREMIMLGSNSYLGLTNDPRVIKASIEATKTYGYGAGSVPLYSGTCELHIQLEKRLAEWYRCEDAIIFPTGYAANVGTISALLRKEDVAVNDLFNHASIYDGCKLSGAAMHTFAHRSMRRLESVLRNVTGPEHGTLVITDGVFSMEGDLAPLDDILTIARRHNARVMLDDSHALGVIGPTGRGTAELYGVEGQIDLTVGTLSKCLGGIGGVVAGTHDAIEYLRFYARSFFFSGAVPPPVIAGALAALDILETEPHHLASLWKNIRYVTGKLRELGFDLGHTASAIIPIIIGEEMKLKELLRELLAAGVFMNFVAFPAVPRRRARLRMSMMSGHTQADLDYVIETLSRLGKKYGVIS